MKRRIRSKTVKTRRQLIPIPFTSCIALIAACALFYLWLCGQCDELGRMLKDQEQQQEVLQRRFHSESMKWANMRALENIREALDRHELTMGWPTRDQIVRLYDVDVERTYSMVGLRSGSR